MRPLIWASAVQVRPFASPKRGRVKINVITPTAGRDFIPITHLTTNPRKKPNECVPRATPRVPPLPAAGPARAPCLAVASAARPLTLPRVCSFRRRVSIAPAPRRAGETRRFRRVSPRRARTLACGAGAGLGGTSASVDMEESKRTRVLLGVFFLHHCETTTRAQGTGEEV